MTAQVTSPQNTLIQLNELPKGKLASIERIEFAEPICRRLAQMGLSQGETISVIRPSIAKSPLMVRTQGAYIMVRYQDAQHIYVGLNG
jgi:Fe2+ transport system protein FeoA